MTPVLPAIIGKRNFPTSRRSKNFSIKGPPFSEALNFDDGSRFLADFESELANAPVSTARIIIRP